MSPGVCKAIGYAFSWLVVCGLFTFAFGVPLWATIFTNLWVLFAVMALVEGKGRDWLGGRFGDSKFVGLGAEVAVASVVSMVVCWPFGIGEAHINTFLLIIGALTGAALSGFTAGIVDKFTHPLRF